MTGTAQSLRPNSKARWSLSAALASAVLLVAGVLPTLPAQAQTEKLLHSFGQGSDGAIPNAGVIRDTAGNFYGTTSYGGTFGLGTVFRLSKDGETILYSFAGKDGAQPGNLLLDKAGNLFGYTGAGGDLTCNNGSGCGTVFKLSATGKETVLHRFANSKTDGGYPTGLVRDAKGNFYGTTELGGASNNGTVFKLDPTGKEPVLYSFRAGPDGANPNGVVLDAAGNLYGSTGFGGSGSFGTVFKLDAAGNETILYSFVGEADGAT